MMEMFFKYVSIFPHSGHEAGTVCFTSASQCVLHTVIYIALSHTVPYLVTKKIFAKLS